MKNKTEPISWEKLRERDNDPNLFHMVFSIAPARPLARLFAVTLEYEHYSPWSPKNEDYDMVVSNWEGMVWCTISIPSEEKDIAFKVAEEVGVHLKKSYPVVYNRKGPMSFPLRNVHTVINVEGSPVYEGKSKEILEEEDRKITELISSHEEKHNGREEIQGNNLT